MSWALTKDGETGRPVYLYGFTDDTRKPIYCGLPKNSMQFDTEFHAMTYAAVYAPETKPVLV
jgi:hypothetical protein